MAERAVVDFQRRIRRRTSKGDNIRGTSAAKWLQRDKITEIRWFGSSKNFVSKRKYLIVYSFFNFEPVYRSERRVIWENLGALRIARDREFWMS